MEEKAPACCPLSPIKRDSSSEDTHGEFSKQKHSQSRELEPPDAPCSVVVVLPPLCNKSHYIEGDCIINNVKVGR